MSDELTYLLTWTVKGTWLHGDERGSVDRDHARPGEPFLPQNHLRAGWEEGRQLNRPVLLDSRQRSVVDLGIQQVCLHRGWTILAIAVRTNHVHVVVRGTAAPEKMMGDFKAYASRALNAESEAQPRWTRHGSTRYLNSEESVTAAIQYVLHGQ